jgi:hypothetical protein
MSGENYEILGRYREADLVGHAHPDLNSMMIGATAGAPGMFNWGTLIDAAAEAAQQGVTYKQQQDAAAASASATSASVGQSIATDAAWANAETQLALAQQGGNAQAIAAAQQIASSMAGASAAKGAGLTGDAAAKRVAAAQDASNKAAQASLAAPSDKTAAARMQAWQKVLAGVMSGGAGSSSSSGAMVKFKGESESALMKKFGGVPVWGWGVAGLGILTGIVILARRR